MNYLPIHGISNHRCRCGNPNCRSPGKHPKTRNGVLDAKPNIEIKDGNNVAVRTGEESGIWVLDVDDPADCPWEFDTLTCETGIGFHYYFQWSPGIRNRTKINGRRIDVRGTNGYVLVPPSTHINGKTYRWTNESPIIEAPQFLLELVRG
jgi:hypothetical protein